MDSPTHCRSSGGMAGDLVYWACRRLVPGPQVNSSVVEASVGNPTGLLAFRTGQTLSGMIE